MPADPTPAAAGPLAGVTVVDLTRILAGPYCTMILADLGARVIKVERPGVGDDARHIGPFGPGGSAYFASVNRGKESIDLDLKAPADRAVLDALLARADVLVENFRPGTMHDLGYDWDTVRGRWPRLVMVSVSGFGQTGPLREAPAFDMVVQAMSGLMSITGSPGGEPTRVGTSIGDLAAGLFAATGALAALHQRDATGHGAQVDVAMLDCQLSLLENAIARYGVTGEVPGPIGSRHPSVTPFGVFAARDGAVVLAAGNDTAFARLCDVIGRPGLAADERFATVADRNANEPALRAELEAALADADVTTWLARLGAAGLPTAPVNDVAGALAPPQVAARAMAMPVAGGAVDGLVVAGNAVKVSTQADRTAAPPVPALGEHRAALLAELTRNRGDGR